MPARQVSSRIATERIYDRIFWMRWVRVFVFLSIALGLWKFAANRRLNALRDRTRQFNAAHAGGDFEKAWGFMVPWYREIHSLEEFRGLNLPSWPDPGGFSIGFDTASVYQTPVGFLDPISGRVQEWQKVDGEWYFTGQWSLSLD